MRRECRERFSRHRLQSKLLVSDPGMHHGTCVTHVPWCMSGSLILGFGENVPAIPVACATRNFTYLARGPLFLIFLSDSDVQAIGLKVKPGEVLIVVLILCAWFGAIALFLNKWGKIRLSTPSEPRYKHSPKNIDTVKVCKRSTDSVIYKSYPKQLSRTMLAREKRIARMNTMPNIKISENIKPINRLETMPVIEMEETVQETSLSWQPEESHEKVTPLWKTKLMLFNVGLYEYRNCFYSN